MAEASIETRKSSKDEALDILRGELEQASAKLRDITAKITTLRGQAEQLAQRNAQIMGEVRHLESALEQTPRETVQAVYAEALDTQQRLLTARAQLERLQTEEGAVRQAIEQLNLLTETLSRADEKTGPVESFNAHEMIIRVIDAQEEQSERLARLMHDGPAHALTNFILQAEICQKLFERDPDKVREELANLKAAASEAFTSVRGFIFDLRPMMLRDLGLVPTLKRYVEAFQEKSSLKTEFNLTGREIRVEHYREVLIFRGIQALMQNARDSSGASSVKLTLDMSQDRIRAIVENDGGAFGTGKLRLNADDSESVGLGALRERVKLVGGDVRVEPLAGQGVRVEIDIPSGPVVQT